MLIGFSAENFRCYNDEINVSLIAENSARNCFYIGSKVPIISHMAICGENSTGKTSLLSVLTLVRDIAKQGKIPEYAKGWYNRLYRSNRNRETTLEIVISIGSVTYSYGIRVCLNTGVIYREWINELSSNGSSLLLLGRDEDNAFSLARRDEFSKDDHLRFRLYTEDLSSKELMLTRLAGVSFREESGLRIIKKIHNYISNFIISLDRDGSPLKIKINQDMNVAYELLSLLNSLGADVTNILLKNSQLPSCISRDELSTLNEGAGILCRSNNDLQLIVRNDNGETEVSQLVMEHSLNGETLRLNYADESSSTRKLIDLAVLFCNSDSIQNVILVDDIDEGLSLSLMTGLFSYIDYEFTEKRQQIIFTTRDSEDVYPVYCLEAQNIFHACRDGKLGFTLNETHPDSAGYDDGGSFSEYEADFAESDDSEQSSGDQSYVQLPESDTANDSIDSSDDEQQTSFKEEEEVEADYHSRASSLPHASPLEDKEFENWSESGSDDYVDAEHGISGNEPSANESDTDRGDASESADTRKPLRKNQKDRNGEGRKNSKPGRKKKEHQSSEEITSRSAVTQNDSSQEDSVQESGVHEEEFDLLTHHDEEGETGTEESQAGNSDPVPDAEGSQQDEKKGSRQNRSGNEKKTGKRGSRKNTRKQSSVVTLDATETETETETETDTETAPNQEIQNETVPVTDDSNENRSEDSQEKTEDQVIPGQEEIQF